MVKCEQLRQEVGIIKYAAWAAILVIAVASCSPYTFNPKGKSSFTSIAVERFENNTAEHEISDRMTDLIIDAFIADGNLKVVSTENAEVLLIGTLTSYDRRPFDYDENDQVQSYSVEMAFDITLRNIKDQTDVWSERLTQRGTYRVVDQVEEDAQNEAISLLVEGIINKTTRSW